MLEGIVTSVLNNYVGEYLENLNADQLSIAILQGQVELENVPLKKTALRKFDVPLQVKSGVIGKLSLSIPITRMRSEPWILKISDLLILLGPSDQVYDGSDVEGYEQTKKAQLLEALEAHHKAQLSLNFGLPLKDEATQNQYWGASLVSAVSNNIQLILSNVHIRYEDSTTMPNQVPFNFGIRIQHISIQTTNSHWKQEFVQPSEGVNTFKKLDIKGFSVFWNTHQEVHQTLSTPAELKAAMLPESSKSNQFILQPFSMQARMEKNTSKFPLKTLPLIPRFKFDLRPEKISIEITKKQLAQIRLLSREWARYERARQHRKWRPVIGIKEKDGAKAWWKFAINGIVNETRRNRERSTLNFLYTRAKHFNLYCKAYKKSLEAYIAEQQTAEVPSSPKSITPDPLPISLTAEDKAFMKQIEHDSQYSYHELHVFREVVFRQLMRQKEDDKGSSEGRTPEPFEVVTPTTTDIKNPLSAVNNQDNNEQSQGIYGWVSSWFGSASNNKEESKNEEDVNEAAFLEMWPNAEKNKKLPPNLRKIEKKVEEEILDVLNESWDDSTILRRDNLLAEVVFRLERIIIRFIDEEPSGNSRVLAMDWRQVACRVQLSPREHRTEISLSVGDMSVHRMKIGSSENLQDVEDDLKSISDSGSEEDETDLFFGFSDVSKFAPQLLFAIGRAKEEVSDVNGSIEQQQLTLITDGIQKVRKPLFQMVYRRMAPRLDVLHELEANFTSLSVIYDEDALSGLADFFDTETAFIEPNSDNSVNDISNLASVGETHCFLNFAIPSIMLELRSRRISLANKDSHAMSNPFACARLANVKLGISKTEPLLSKLKISLGSLIIDDLYEKNVTMPLIKTIENRGPLAAATSLSSSCPDLRDGGSEFSRFSSSLPNEFKPIVFQKPLQLPPTNHFHRRSPRTPVTLEDDDFGDHTPDGPVLNLTFVDSSHRDFDSKYGKRNCIVDAEFGGIDFAMNRRTWTMLFDFFGACGEKVDPLEVDPATLGPFNDDDLKLLYGSGNIPEALKKDTTLFTAPKSKRQDYVLNLKLAITTARIHMTYPKNQTQLGTIFLNSGLIDMKINLSDPQDPMLLNILASELFIHDETPFYSRLYTERLALRPLNRTEASKQSLDELRKLRINIVKYRTDDPDLKRDCDMRVNMTMDYGCSLHYIHTHRFFCGIMDFWMNFADLQDQVRRTNENIGFPEEQQKTRALINIKFHDGASLILPLNQFSDQVICLKTSSIDISNRFQLGSQTSELTEQSVDNKTLDYDCLLDKMSVSFSSVSIHDGYRVSVDEACDSRLQEVFSDIVGRETFQNYYFAVQENGILTRKCDLNIGVYRNLSGLISHNAPDLAILAKFENIDLLFSTDFYCLLRGFLEKNLGDPLTIVPETIPTEILLNPERGYAMDTTVKYPTFSFRLTFENVQFHFLVPQNPQFPAIGKVKKFGRMILHKARISYDCYIDGLAEFDLICESTELIDTRFEDVADKQAIENVFPVILTSKDKERPQGGHFVRLMSEAHIMMKKEEAPVVTLVLQNSTIILTLDWLNNAKDFFLLNTTFVPPEELPSQKGLYGFPKDGVLTRTISNSRPSPLHTITLKITLRDSDLIFLEQTNNPSSLALVCFTTAVLNLNDQYGVFEVNFEMQKLSCTWCMMSSQEQTSCQVSNDFTATVLIKRDMLPIKDQAQALLSGLNEAIPLIELPKQKISIEIGQLVARLSYKDMLVIMNVMQRSLARLESSFKNYMIPKQQQPPGRPPFVFQKIFVSFEHLCFWFLDDSQGVALPMLRLILSSLQLESNIGENLTATFQINVDYFNQRVFGWEPFIEPWRIKELTALWKQDYLHLALKTDHQSPLDFNVTQTLIQQMKHFHSKWPLHKKTLDRDFRNLCTRSRSDHLPYLLKNETGSSLLFTTQVEEVTKARSSSRKPNAKWFSVPTDKSCTFEFPTKRLIAREKCNEPRQLIVRVDGWDEVSPVDVDSVGTYFRVAKILRSSTKRETSRARIVVAVTMDLDGRKVVTIRSSLLAINRLPDPIFLTFTINDSSIKEGAEYHIAPGERFPIPLKFANSKVHVRPATASTSTATGQLIDWRKATVAGDIVDQLHSFETDKPGLLYWISSSIKRENYPEYESLPGHTIVFVPPMTVVNLLPVDVDFSLETSTRQHYQVGAGKRYHVPYVNLDDILNVTFRTEQFKTIQPITLLRTNFLNKTILDEKRIEMPMMDANQRTLLMYGSVYIDRGGSLSISIWVPYWIVNRSGIPLIIKQEGAVAEAAGQFQDHEKAKDRNPLMFSFSDQDCPDQCVVRVGRQIENDEGYKPKYSPKFALSSGVQSLKLLLTHEVQATLMYDIGLEVRQCTGRYKNTQIVLFTPRYRLNNQASTQLFVCHHEDVTRPSQHIPLASKCNLIWHETFEDKRRLCIRRSDVAYWSYPFRIDQIGSFHVTMRDKDETPKFVRVEVALNGASFWVTFTDAYYFPAPIKIENQSNVPVLYQQASKEHNHFRTICKANSTVEYFWDDLYGEKLLTLQVYENKSYSYDPSKPKRGPSLVYENFHYIQYAPSFNRSKNRMDTETEDHDLVLEARVNGKVVLNKMNMVDSSQRQLWKWASDGSLENVGMNHTAKSGDRYVLDVLDLNGNALMVVKRDVARNMTQKWKVSNAGALICCVKGMVVEAIDKNKLILTKQTPNMQPSQHFSIQRQKPGSGVLDVECLQVGPTLVVRIVDHYDTKVSSLMPISSRGYGDVRSRSPASSSVLSQRRRKESQSSFNFDGELHMSAGIGVSLVNNSAEELIYARFQGVQMHFCRVDKTYQITGHVNLIQVDNQLLTTERWQVLYCSYNALKNGEIDSPLDNGSDTSPLGSDSSIIMRPALKLEMNCTPMEHYDAFDCFRVKLCDMCVLLDETLLWKVIQFIQQTGTADVVSKDSMIQPPNIEPDMNVPGSGSEGVPIRRCYFGTLDLEVGNVALTVLTVAKNGLTKDLQELKRQFNIKLVSFENALITLPPFRQFHYFETLNFLIESLSKFYMMELQKQTINIVFTMDAFGNPRGLATDLKESFQGLIFEADITGFVYGLGYGVTNSLSKVASSMSHGVGSLTFDEQHELMRRRMMRIQPQADSNAAFSHFCNGVKGFGVGVFGGLTAIAGNTIKTTKKEGVIAGITKGLVTGAVDTVTKPAQGFFDFLEGTASAVKEVVGSHSSRKSRFAERRTRLPRVCTNLQSLLPVYSTVLAEAQQELLRINGYSTNEVLYDVEVILRHHSNDYVEQKVLICSEQCYCLRQINDSPPSVIQRIPYRSFKNIFIDTSADVGKGLACITVTYDTSQKSIPNFRIVCGDKEVARRLCEKVLRSKQLYDHTKRSLSMNDDMDN